MDPKNRMVSTPEKTEPPEEKLKPGMVKVRSLAPLHEEGHRDVGDVFVTSESRAEALGALVEKV